MFLSNFHTHTVFGDGRHTPEEVVLSAIDKGFDALGFSEHAYIDFDPESSMSRSDTPLYKSAVRSLKDKYQGKIKIFLGAEQDIYSTSPTDGFDYIIGSVHYVKQGDEYITVDYSREYLIDKVNERFGGDIYSFCELYYETVSRVVEKTDCDIIGHFDLVTKYNEDGNILDEENPRYRRAAERALEKLAAENRFFEINTGAISRGYRSTPYPSPFLLKRLAQMGARVILSSDSHNKDTLDCAFAQAASLAESCGFTRSSLEKNALMLIEKIENKSTQTKKGL